jgi:hypothetical protein
MAMEADWEVEIGPDAPIIEALWPGFVDLQRAPERIREIEEASRFPALADALLRLNTPVIRELDSAPGSLVWTSKCDIWTPQECDPDEMDAMPSEAATGLACYLDLLPRKGLVFSMLPEAESWARVLVNQLRLSKRRCCRTDLIIRKAFAANEEGLGITAYIASCGIDSVAAAKALVQALALFVDSITGNSSLAENPNKSRL